MRTIKRLLAAGLAVAMLGSVPAFAAGTDGLEHFQPVAAYSDGLFTDLDAGGWYMENVKTAYELGLMKGIGSGSFSPDGTISLGETIALAARVHSIYETGEADFVQGSPWYQVYVDYAAENGIFTGSASTDYGAPATRSQFAAILAAALPEEALEPINTVDDGMIPDVPVGAANYDAIYLLYRAGVLTGSDGKGTYQPETSIGRSSVAALVTRMVKPELRQPITLEDESTEFKVTLSHTSLNLTQREIYVLTAIVRPASADMTVTWSSSNPSVASVSSDGAVTAEGGGTAIITATVGDASATCTVTVKANPIDVTGIFLSESSLTLSVGDTQKLTATLRPNDAEDKNVTWSSSNTAVATVSSSGTVTAVAEGTAVITAKASSGVSATCRVTVEGEEENQQPTDVGQFDEDFSPFQPRPVIDGAYVLFLEEQNGSHTSSGFFYVEEFAASNKTNWSRRVEITYTVSDPDVVAVEFVNGSTARFYVRPLAPGRCTITAKAGQDTSTFEILVPDTSLNIEGHKSSLFRSTDNNLGKTFTFSTSAPYTFHSASIGTAIGGTLDSSNSSGNTYTIYLTATNPDVEHEVTIGYVMLDTGSGPEKIGEITVPAAKHSAGSNKYGAGTLTTSFTFTVPHGADAVISFEEPDESQQLPVINVNSTVIYKVNDYVAVTIQDASLTDDGGCSFEYCVHLLQVDRLPDLLTFDIYLVSRDYNTYRSPYYHVELSLEGYQDGDKVTGTGFIPDLPTYGDYWFRSPQNFIPIS